MFIVYNIIAVSCICQQYMMDCNKIITRPVRLRLTFSQGVIIIKKLNNKSCDGDSRPYGKLAANWGWWEPGTSKYGGISLLSFSSEVVRQQPEEYLIYR